MNAPDPAPPTLAGLVDAADRDRPALVTPSGTVTYGELAARAALIAGQLVDRAVDRFACLVDDQAALVAVLVASSAVGAEACVYSTALDDLGIAELVSAFDHTLVVTDRALDLEVATLAPADLASGPKMAGWPDRGGPSPVMILTTGTTGRPKGARHDWRRLIAGGSRWTSPPDSRWLVAYNLNQFAGYQVLVHGIASGATLVFPQHNQPREALRAMVAHGVTHASATPTFWRFVLALLHPGDPLPPLAQITLGGESVPGDLLEELRDRFPEARVSQVYASTEFGSGAAANDAENGLPLSVLDRGPDADVQMRIVDGELHVRSRVGMLGYYGMPDDGEAWRPTGDMVEIRGDRIHFVGRSVEIINVGGVKVHPLVIEEKAMGVPGVRLAHARGRANPVAGQIVQLDVVADDGANLEELESMIRAACDDLPPAAHPRRIRFVDDLEIKEHKVRRSGPVDGHDR